MSKYQYKIEFDYKDSKNTIKWNKGVKIKDIFKKYGMKAGIVIKSKGFIFNNKILTEELALDKTFCSKVIQNNLIRLKVMPLNEIDKKNYQIKSLIYLFKIKIIIILLKEFNPKL